MSPSSPLFPSDYLATPITFPYSNAAAPGILFARRERQSAWALDAICCPNKTYLLRYLTDCFLIFAKYSMKQSFALHVVQIVDTEYIVRLIENHAYEAWIIVNALKCQYEAAFAQDSPPVCWCVWRHYILMPTGFTVSYNLGRSKVLLAVSHVEV